MQCFFGALEYRSKDRRFSLFPPIPFWCSPCGTALFDLRALALFRGFAVPIPLY